MNIRKKMLKQELRQAFEAPEPVGKEKFLKMYQERNENTWQFLWNQLCYIQWSTWGLMLGLFLLTVFLTLGKLEILKYPYTSLFMISYIIPFWPCVLVRESAKSRNYGMMELEISSRYSLRRLILARVSILGISEFILLCILTGFANRMPDVGLLNMVQYLLVPLLLTSFLSLLIIQRSQKDNETMYCLVVSVFVSMLMFVMTGGFPQIYQSEFMLGWVGAFALLLAGNGLELCVMHHRMEEGKWNLS